MKSMKKSMFVTTILMVVLLVVALSTATFAWYTQNTQTGATKTSVTSASSNSASLVIDSQVAGQNDTNSSVDLTLTGTNKPMVYTSDTAVSGSTTYETFIAGFKTFTRDSAGKFGSEVSSVDPAVITASTGVARTGGGGATSDVIVLTNVGGNSIATLKTTVTIDPYYFYTEFPTTEGVTSVAGKYTYSAGVYTLVESGTAEGGTTYYTRSAAQDHLRVAVFACPTNAVTNEAGHSMPEQLVLKGIYGAGTAQRASATGLGGAITIGTTDIATTVGAATLNSDLSAAGTFKASGEDLVIATSVPAYGSAGNSIYVKVVVWFEGTDMNNADAGQTAAFTMDFSA